MWIFDRHRHLSHDRLSEYIGNRLSPEERARIDGAVAECALCRKELESLGETRSLLQSLPQLEPSRSFVMARAPVAAAGVALAPARPLVFRAPSWAYAGAASLAGLAIALVLVTDGGGLWSRPDGENFPESMTMASPAPGGAPVTTLASGPYAEVAEEAQAVPIPAGEPAMSLVRAAPAQEMAEATVLNEVPNAREAEVTVEVEAEHAMSASAIVSVAPEESTSVPAAMDVPEPETADLRTATPSIKMGNSAVNAVEAPPQFASDQEVMAMAKAEATDTPTGVSGRVPTTLEPAGVMVPESSPGEAVPQGGMGRQGPAGGDSASGPLGPPGPPGEAGPQGSAALPGPAEGYAIGSSNIPESAVVEKQTVATGGSIEASPADVPSPTKVQGTGYADREASPVTVEKQDTVESEAVAESVEAGRSLPDPSQESPGSASVVGESEGPEGQSSPDLPPQADLPTGGTSQEVPPIAMVEVGADDTSAFATGRELGGKTEVQSTAESAPGAVSEGPAAIETEATHQDRVVTSSTEEPEAKEVEPSAIDTSNSLEEDFPRVLSESDSADDDGPKKSWLESRWVAIAAAVAIVVLLAMASAYRFVGAGNSTR